MAFTTLVGNGSSGNGVADANASHSTYCSIGCGFCIFTTTTQANTQTKWKDAGTFKALSAFVVTNARGTATTLALQITGSTGNEIISVGAGLTGAFSDLVDTDATLANALVNYIQTTGSGVGNFLCGSISNAFVGNGAVYNSQDWNSPQATGNGFLDYMHPAGRNTGNSVTENSGNATRIKACTLSQFYVFLTANSLNNNSTGRARIGLANGNNSVSAPANTPGLFQDLIDSDVVPDNTLADWLLDVTGSNGGSASWAAGGAWMEYNTGTGLQNFSQGQQATITTGTGTQFMPFMGTPSLSATESNTQLVVPAKLYWQNLRILTDTSPTTNVSYVSRKNGANGFQSVSIPNGTNGTYEDSLDFDPLVIGDLINSAFVLGASNAFQWHAATNQIAQGAIFIPHALRRFKPRKKANWQTPSWGGSNGKRIRVAPGQGGRPAVISNARGFSTIIKGG